MARSGESFASLSCRELRERGLQGEEVRVRLEGSTLTLSDADGRSVAIPAAQVDRLRHFRIDPVRSLHVTTPTQYETKIWWGGGRRPLVLVPYGKLAGYRRIVRTFAGQVAALHGLDRLRLGPGRATAFVNLLIVGPPVLLLFAFILSIAVLDGGWWWAGAVAALLLFGWLAGRNLRSRWPRRLRDLDQLDSALR